VAKSGPQPRKTSQGPKHQTLDRTPGQKKFSFLFFFCRRKCGRDRRPNFKIGRRKETVSCGRKLSYSIYIYVCSIKRPCVRLLYFLSVLSPSHFYLVPIYIYDSLSIGASGCNRLKGHIYMYTCICRASVYYVFPLSIIAFSLLSLLLPSYSYLLSTAPPHPALHWH
jgi:hypothetical protein